MNYIEEFKNKYGLKDYTDFKIVVQEKDHIDMDFDPNNDIFYFDENDELLCDSGRKSVTYLTEVLYIIMRGRHCSLTVVPEES